MTSKPSLTLPVSTRLPEQAARRFLAVLQKVFLPHLLVGLGIFLLLSYITYWHFFAPLQGPNFIKKTLLWLLLGGYGCAAVFYACLAAGLFSLRLACVAWGELIDNLLTQVKERALARLSHVEEGLAKDQAKLLVRGSVREVFREAKQRPMGLPKWAAAAVLGTITLALRSVLLARLVKLSGTTIQLSKLFASPTLLAGAVFLNLRLFTTVLLGLVYLTGATVLLLNIALVYRW